MNIESTNIKNTAKSSQPAARQIRLIVDEKPICEFQDPPYNGLSALCHCLTPPPRGAVMRGAGADMCGAGAGMRGAEMRGGGAVVRAGGGIARY